MVVLGFPHMHGGFRGRPQSPPGHSQAWGMQLHWGSCTKSKLSSILAQDNAWSKNNQHNFPVTLPYSKGFKSPLLSGLLNQLMDPLINPLLVCGHLPLLLWKENQLNKGKIKIHWLWNCHMLSFVAFVPYWRASLLPQYLQPVASGWAASTKHTDPVGSR